MEKQSRIPLATWRRAALISILLFFSLFWILIDSVLSVSGSAEGTVLEIPLFCGMQESEIARHPRMVFRTEYRYDDTAARGTVLSQSPRAGTKKKLYDGEATVEVRLWVSLGKQTHTLPSFFGTDAREAEATLRAIGVCADIRSIKDDAMAGKVLRQSPLAGTSVAKGDTVTLWVGAPTPTRTAEVPNLCGLSRAQALIELAAAGLSLGEISETEGTEDTAGTVVKQSHLPGTTVLAGTKITITVAREEESE